MNWLLWILLGALSGFLVRVPLNRRTGTLLSFLCGREDAFCIVPEETRAISAHAFGGCRSLRSVMLPQGLERIGSAAFAGCESLLRVGVPGSVSTIGPDAFRACGSVTLEAPAGSLASYYAQETGVSLRER